MRIAARTDANHAEVVRALRAVGCLVHDTSAAGNGFPDLVVARPGGRGLLLVEVKDGRKPEYDRPLTKQQKEFAATWAAHWALVTSVDEAIRVVTG